MKIHLYVHVCVSTVYSVLFQCQDPAVCPCTPQGECFPRQQTMYLSHCLLRHYTNTTNMRLEGKVANMAGVETDIGLDVSTGTRCVTQFKTSAKSDYILLKMKLSGTNIMVPLSIVTIVFFNMWRLRKCQSN